MRGPYGTLLLELTAISWLRCARGASTELCTLVVEKARNLRVRRGRCSERRPRAVTEVAKPPLFTPYDHDDTTNKLATRRYLAVRIIRGPNAQNDEFSGFL